MRLIASSSLAVSVAGIGLAALVAGCASSGSPASSPPATATSSAKSGGAAASGVAAGGQPGASSSVRPGGGLAILPCPTSGLKVAKGTTGDAAGSMYLQIDFTNTSGRTCLLNGYPGVSLTSSTTPGSQVGPAATKATTKPEKVITLAPGAVASATLQVVDVLNYSSSTCDPVTGNYLQVYPPGQTSAAYVPFHGQTCAKPVFALGITTVVAGA